MNKFALALAAFFAGAMIAGLPSMAVAQPEEAPGTDEVAARAAANAAFLEEFAAEDGVIKRASGLLIKIVRQGAGGIVDNNQQAVVHYEGRLIDGTVFDSSYERGTPSVFYANEVIRGWSEALSLMQIGSKWEIAMPPRLGYGARDDIGPIPPGSALVFTVELLGKR